jgi:transcriptional regulator with PAS, ATPase and Fis domain
MNAKTKVQEYTPEKALRFLELALREDHSLANLIECIEKTVIAAAYHRHRRTNEIYQALRMPKTTFYSKWRRYFR